MSAISHVTFMTRDLAGMRAIMEDVLGATLVHDGDGSRRAREMFFMLDDAWLAVVEGKGPATPTYDHVAFAIREDEFEDRLARVRALGLSVEASRPRGRGEARSIYFRDRDNHLIELHTGTLAERLAWLRGEDAQ